MGAPDLLQHLRASGFELDVSGDRLMVTPASRLTDGDRAGIRNFKVELLALLTRQPALDSASTASTSATPTPSPDLAPAAAGQSCDDCQHILPHFTCAKPVDAGLADSFGIRWAPEGHAAGCAAFSGNPQKEPAGQVQRQSYRLSADEGNRCHAPCWEDAEIGRFLTRHAHFVRLGMVDQDADDLAERLALRDRDGDGRRMCLECSELGPSGRCGAVARGALPAVNQLVEPVSNILIRCQCFRPAVNAHGTNQGNLNASNHD